MTAVLISLVVALSVIVLLLVGMLRVLNKALDTLSKREHEHTACANSIIFHTGGQFAAFVLEQAADDWETVDNLKVLDRLRREWRPGKEGIASYWMRDKARQWREREGG